jgi:ABC-type nitrate/sulfonate/bicarbonate transport system permease component
VQRLIVVPFWLGLWAGVSALFDLNNMLLPDFQSVLINIRTLLSTQSYYEHFFTTLSRLVPGLAGSIILGIPMGLLLAQSTWARHLLEPIITLIRGIPVAALFPVAILLFGIGDGARAALTVYVAFPILVTSTLAGAMERPENRIRRDYLNIHKQRCKWYDMPLCLLWDAAPSIIGGTKVAMGLSLVVIIVSEMFFVGGKGIGWFTWDQYQAFNFQMMYASIVIIGVFSVALDTLFELALRKRGA